MESKFYFKISKELHLVEDENGNSGEAYICANIKHNKPIEDKEQYNVIANSARTIVINQLKCDRSFVTPITEEEYIKNTEPEEIICASCGEVITDKIVHCCEVCGEPLCYSCSFHDDDVCTACQESLTDENSNED